jgi:hypothetical protein
VFRAGIVECSVVSLACTPSIEAVEADVQTGGIVLPFVLDVEGPLEAGDSHKLSIQLSQNTGCSLRDTRLPLVEAP